MQLKLTAVIEKNTPNMMYQMIGLTLVNNISGSIGIESTPDINGNTALNPYRSYRNMILEINFLSNFSHFRTLVLSNDKE